MDVNLEEALEQSKIIIGSLSNTGFSEYSRGYLSTTENIGAYLNEVEFNKNRALTVLSSGDQVFNLMLKGVLEIDAFDINKLQYFVYCLKKAMIKELSLANFKKAMGDLALKNMTQDNQDLLNKLKLSMPPLVYEYFWQILEFLHHNYMLGLVNIFGSFVNFSHNLYLASEDNYKKLQRMIEDIPVHLYFLDVKKVPYLVEGDYDIIILSNIADYLGKRDKLLTLEDFQKLISSYYNLLRQDGVLINYLYGINFNPVIRYSRISAFSLGYENIFEVPTNDEGYYLVRKKS